MLHRVVGAPVTVQAADLDIGPAAHCNFYCTVLYSTLLYSTLLYSTLQYSTGLYCSTDGGGILQALLCSTAGGASRRPATTALLGRVCPGQREVTTSAWRLAWWVEGDQDRVSANRSSHIGIHKQTNACWSLGQS